MAHVCPMCGKQCQGAEALSEFVSGLLLDGYKQNYTIKTKTHLYRVNFAHPKTQHVIEFASRSKKNDATRAARLVRKDKNLKKAGWTITKVEGLTCG